MKIILKVNSFFSFVVPTVRKSAICAFEFSKRKTNRIETAKIPSIGSPTRSKLQPGPPWDPPKPPLGGMIFRTQKATKCCLPERLANGKWTLFERFLNGFRTGTPFWNYGYGFERPKQWKNVAFFHLSNQSEWVRTGSNALVRVWHQNPHSIPSTLCSIGLQVVCPPKKMI